MGERRRRDAAGRQHRRRGSGKAPLLVNVGILRAYEFASLDRLERRDLAVVAEDDELADEALLLGHVDRSERH